MVQPRMSHAIIVVVDTDIGIHPLIYNVYVYYCVNIFISARACVDRVWAYLLGLG